MAEDEIVDGRVVGKILAGEDDEGLVFALKGERFGFAFAAMGRPAEGEGDGPPGMDGRVELLANFVAEDGADEAEGWF